MKYYIVTAKCGHVGKNKYILIDFPVVAEDGETAAQIVRLIPRVKHDHKDAIKEVKQVDYDLYYERNSLNFGLIPYFESFSLYSKDFNTR